MNLVIVESPTKARTIGRFLGKNFAIKASMGHIVDLPKSTLAIDINHNFAPQYEMVIEKKQIISDLKRAAKSAGKIILATDPDREGEAIASHVKDVLISGLKFPTSSRSAGLRGASKVQSAKFQRIVFHEITKEAINEALKNPREIDRNLVDAQTARRVLDRLVGYKLSPLLWKKVRRGLSAGRVQSVALRLIVEREREIEKFGKEKYWTLHVILNSFQDPQNVSKEMLKQVQHDNGEGTPFELVEINGEKIELVKVSDLYDGQYKVTKTSIDSAKNAEEIVADLKTKAFIVSDVLQKEAKRTPLPPYTTSTLQQDASRRLYINGKRTMSLAQKLYEEGYITYHRTDSVTISSSAIFAIINFVKKKYGEKYVPKKPRFYSAKQKLAQEAHEAIRPTAFGEITNYKLQITNLVGNQGWKLYELIWKRAVASQMSDAVIESTTVIADSFSVIPNSFRDPKHESKEMLKQVQHDKKEYKLKVNGSVLVFDGFLKVNPLGLSDNKLPRFSTGENLNLIDTFEKEHETLPPPRYNDASIIKTLEEKGIGRPSTYATIISTIESRGYIERAEGKFSPTSVGIAVNDFLVANFSDIDDIPFTALIENDLDNIANGQRQWAPMMKDFYAPFEKKLEEVEGAERVKIAVEKTDEKCPECKSFLVIRTGRFGKFLACSTFPTCKFTKAFIEETGLACPKDSGKIVVKKTRKGRRFYGCSNYPACDFASWTLPKSTASNVGSSVKN